MSDPLWIESSFPPYEATDFRISLADDGRTVIVACKIEGPFYLSLQVKAHNFLRLKSMIDAVLLEAKQQHRWSGAAAR